jgi:hypothetical protein
MTAAEVAGDAGHDEIAVLIKSYQPAPRQFGWLSNLWRK